MMRIVVIFFLVSVFIRVNAQTVSNVSATQQGQDIVVSYSLQTEEACEVFFYISTDSGRSWQGPLSNCTGDVGKSISAGPHQIVWEVLKDREKLEGNGIQFKVVAKGRKSFEPEMVFVEGGTFMMGSEFASEKRDKLVSKVKVSDFSIGKYEITQKQWRYVMGSNPSYFKDCDQCPVEQISWQDAQQFIAKLNTLSGKKYRLPNQAEWEYAARGGNLARGYQHYSGSNDRELVAWTDRNSTKRTHPVGQLEPNELGIYDMSGNVCEWCCDINKNNYQTPGNTPLQSSNEYYVYRGDDIFSPTYNISSLSGAVQNPSNERTVACHLGLRLVLSDEKKINEPEMVFVEGGTFIMGSNNNESDEMPIHHVTLSDYYIGKFEVTQSEWLAIFGINPSNFPQCYGCPVENVSWNEVQNFISKLNKLTGKKYRLPSEAEWEFAARGGNLSLERTYSGSNDIESVAWYSENSDDYTQPVGQKEANELGIYDMSGNVYEWCSDWYNSYSSSPTSNPSGASNGNKRVIRGGSWHTSPNSCRSSNRQFWEQDRKSGSIGFRLVLSTD